MSPPPRRFKRLERGSIAVSAAFLLLLGVTITAFVVDSGTIYLERVRLDGSARAAALAGALALCSDASTQAALSLEGTSPGARVEVGGFDAGLGTARFQPGRALASEANAVRVRLASSLPTLLRPSARVAGSATAYLRNLGIMSLDDDVEIRAEALRGGFVRARGDVRLSDGPELDDVQVRATGETFATRFVQSGFDPATGQFVSDSFADPRPLSAAGIESGAARLTGVRPVDETTLERYQRDADIRYSDSSPQDQLLYLRKPIANESSPSPHFDLREVAVETGKNVTLYYDGGETTTVSLNPRAASEGREPAGGEIRGITFVTRANIEMRPGSITPGGIDVIGGPGSTRVALVSGGDVTVRVRELDLRGLSIRAGGDVFIIEDTGPVASPVRGLQAIHVVASGKVQIDDPEGEYDLARGPVCPATLARLGPPGDRGRPVLP